MRHFLKPISLLLLLPLLGGCSFFRSPTQVLNIDCAQSQVQLKVNGEPHTCPASVSVRRNEPVNVLATREGYPAQQRTVNIFISTTGVLDLAGGLICLLPAIGLAAPGAFNLNTTQLYIDLRQSPAQATTP